MVPYGYVEITTLEINWFGVDRLGQIGHFANAGMPFVPNVVEKDREGAERLMEYFEGLSRHEGAYCGPEPWDKFLEKSDEKFRFDYLDSVVEWSERGLFACEINSMKLGGNFYQRVSSPADPLLVSDLPSWVRDEPALARLDCSLEEVERIEVSQNPKPGVGVISR